MQIMKKDKEEEEHWPFIQKDKVKRQWLQTDWSRFVDEDEEDEKPAEMGARLPPPPPPLRCARPLARRQQLTHARARGRHGRCCPGIRRHGRPAGHGRHGRPAGHGRHGRTGERATRRPATSESLRPFEAFPHVVALCLRAVRVGLARFVLSPRRCVPNERRAAWTWRP
jgi:hypothetical protein